MMMQVLERMNELRDANRVVGEAELMPCVLIDKINDTRARVTDGMWSDEFQQAVPFDPDTTYTVTVDELRVIAITERVMYAEK